MFSLRPLGGKSDVLEQPLSRSVRNEYRAVLRNHALLAQLLGQFTFADEPVLVPVEIQPVKRF